MRRFLLLQPQDLMINTVHLLPRCPLERRNYGFGSQKNKRNLIFQISVDILQNINFFRAFTASASVPAIYIQQFWNTLTYEAKTRACSFQLDETRFVLDANLLRKALEITPIDQAHQFVSPPSGDAIMDFVNELTSGHDRPRYPVLQMHWGNYYNPTKKGRKDKPHVIPYCRFMKLVICHLGRIHNIHQRSASPFHFAEEDLRLVISNSFPKAKNSPYYNAYLEMVAKHDQKALQPVK
ncbi:hypothetical protein Tco_0231195 [Tanacetum coccineum]